MEAEDAEDKKCETLKEENEFSPTERISLLTEVDNHSTYTAVMFQIQSQKILRRNLVQQKKRRKIKLKN